MCGGDDCEVVRIYVHTFETNKKSVSEGRLAYNEGWEEIAGIQLCRFFPLLPMYLVATLKRTIGCSDTLICPPRQCTCTDANCQWRFA